jgi:DNA-binding CsgD family transcriptional regulator
MLTASSTAQRPVTVILGRFQALAEPTARNDPPQNTPIPGLTPRENEVRCLLSAGYSYREIAETLCVSPETVRTHCKRIYHKLGVSGRRELKASPAQRAPRSDEPPARPGVTPSVALLSPLAPQITHSRLDVTF